VPDPAADLVAKARAGDGRARADLLAQYRPFIGARAAKVVGHYVDDGDDLASVALIAFNEAIDAYDAGRGVSFLTFSETVIRRRLIDHLRKTGREASTPLSAFETEDEEGDLRNPVETSLAVAAYTEDQDAAMRRDEIAAYAQVLARFGVSFAELVDAAPKHQDARESAQGAARSLVSRPELVRLLEETGRLPLRELAEIVPLSRKTLERQRKYVLAVALALLGDFPYLKEYFS